jgi:hypothetical protein
MASLQENIRHYQQAMRESLAITLANINYYRAICLQKVTFFATYSRDLIRSGFQVFAQTVINSYQFIVRHLRPFPAWLFNQFVQGLQQLYGSLYEAAANFYIIVRALPNLGWQLVKGTYQFLKNAAITSYQLFGQLGEAIFAALKNALSLVGRNFFPALKGAWRILKRTCFNIIDEIRHLPHYAYQAFIVTQEILRILLQKFVDLVIGIVNVLRPILSFVVRKTLNGLFNTVAFILGFIAALFDATLGLFRATPSTPPRGIVADEIETPKTMPSYTPGFKEPQLNQSIDETPVNSAKKRPSLAV